MKIDITGDVAADPRALAADAVRAETNGHDGLVVAGTKHDLADRMSSNTPYPVDPSVWPELASGPRAS